MRHILTLALAALTPVAAAAHPGHVAEAGDHTHYVAVAALVLAVLVAGGTALRHRLRIRREARRA
ncbi:DUF6732 family protein [Pseudoroseicyclus aestuarii]|uniref:LPXTG-motif cell wall-anchored protein n=1 Tax=Pseudoroseicyclus aestuarii TaxID=1795041 RepID=A0A318SWB8_9RHOB|nr:DUF6732 family protein [Pseudoroseicyclus aestuarii]PYE84679.1 hypothetical protein DFP88_102482 [Pseudoroseicyclus aestuarii]